MLAAENLSIKAAFAGFAITEYRSPPAACAFPIAIARAPNPKPGEVGRRRSRPVPAKPVHDQSRRHRRKKNIFSFEDRVFPFPDHLPARNHPDQINVIAGQFPGVPEYPSQTTRLYPAWPPSDPSGQRSFDRLADQVVYI